MAPLSWHWLPQVLRVYPNDRFGWSQCIDAIGLVNSQGCSELDGGPPELRVSPHRPLRQVPIEDTWDALAG